MFQRKYKQIKSADTPEFLRRRVAIVDIRRSEEWRLTGVVAGSHLLTFFDDYGSCQPEEWLRQLDQLVPVEQPLLLI
ncbi:MAG: hypothetical protein U9R69_02765 [Thermodesulfobacteriota bacterium]|nr:hypothetical protein [Thermodesulfobacteriota bacterium]